jgi:hypothetical protein
MSQENVKLVQGMYEAFSKGDIPAVLGQFDPQIEWNEAENFPYADRNPYVGPVAVLEGLFMRLGSEWEYWNLEIEELLDAGETVVSLGRYLGQNKATRKKIDAQFVHVWKFRDGKVIRFQQYADTAQVRDAVSL